MITVEESVVDPHQGRAVTEDKYENETNGQMRSEKKKSRKEGKRIDVAYDKLAITVGCYSQTFGTKGVKENAFFMKDVGDARRIRTRILECFEIANLPTTSDKLREQLLNFAIVGGGPTGMEFAAELSDLVREDLNRLVPGLISKVAITVYDVAPTVLSMFDEKLSKYAMETFRREGVKIKTSHHIEELRPGLPRTDDSKEDMDDVADSQGCYTLTTKEDGDVGVGLCVWSTGNMMNPFVQKALSKTYTYPSTSAKHTSGTAPSELATNQWMIEKHPKTGAITVDDRLRIQLYSQTPDPTETTNPPSPASKATLTSVFALGDNATHHTHPHPAPAQKANQQALYLAHHLNAPSPTSPPFTYRNMGIMTYIGNAKGVVQTEGWMGDLSGRAAWLVWRGAYLSMSLSWRNRVLMVVYWYVFVFCFSGRGGGQGGG